MTKYKDKKVRPAAVKKRGNKGLKAVAKLASSTSSKQTDKLVFSIRKPVASRSRPSRCVKPDAIDSIPSTADLIIAKRALQLEVINYKREKKEAKAAAMGGGSPYLSGKLHDSSKPYRSPAAITRQHRDSVIRGISPIEDLSLWGLTEKERREKMEKASGIDRLTKMGLRGEHYFSNFHRPVSAESSSPHRKRWVDESGENVKKLKVGRRSKKIVVTPPEPDEGWYNKKFNPKGAKKPRISPRTLVRGTGVLMSKYNLSGLSKEDKMANADIVEVLDWGVNVDNRPPVLTEIDLDEMKKGQGMGKMVIGVKKMEVFVTRYPKGFLKKVEQSFAARSKAQTPVVAFPIRSTVPSGFSRTALTEVSDHRELLPKWVEGIVDPSLLPAMDVGAFNDYHREAHSLSTKWSGLGTLNAFNDFVIPERQKFKLAELLLSGYRERDELIKLCKAGGIDTSGWIEMRGRLSGDSPLLSRGNEMSESVEKLIASKEAVWKDYSGVIKDKSLSIDSMSGAQMVPVQKVRKPTKRAIAEKKALTRADAMEKSIMFNEKQLGLLKGALSIHAAAESIENHFGMDVDYPTQNSMLKALRSSTTFNRAFNVNSNRALSEISLLTSSNNVDLPFHGAAAAFAAEQFSSHRGSLRDQIDKDFKSAMYGNEIRNRERVDNWLSRMIGVTRSIQDFTDPYTNELRGMGHKIGRFERANILMAGDAYSVSDHAARSTHFNTVGRVKLMGKVAAQFMEQQSTLSPTAVTAYNRWVTLLDNTHTQANTVYKWDKKLEEHVEALGSKRIFVVTPGNRSIWAGLRVSHEELVEGYIEELKELNKTIAESTKLRDVHENLDEFGTTIFMEDTVTDLVLPSVPEADQFYHHRGKVGLEDALLIKSYNFMTPAELKAKVSWELGSTFRGMSIDVNLITVDVLRGKVFMYKGRKAIPIYQNPTYPRTFNNNWEIWQYYTYRREKVQASRSRSLKRIRNFDKWIKEDEVVYADPVQEIYEEKISEDKEIKARYVDNLRKFDEESKVIAGLVGRKLAVKSRNGLVYHLGLLDSKGEYELIRKGSRWSMEKTYFTKKPRVFDRLLMSRVVHLESVIDNLLPIYGRKAIKPQLIPVHSDRRHSPQIFSPAISPRSGWVSYISTLLDQGSFKQVGTIVNAEYKRWAAASLPKLLNSMNVKAIESIYLAEGISPKPYEADRINDYAVDYSRPNSIPTDLRSSGLLDEDSSKTYRARKVLEREDGVARTNLRKLSIHRQVQAFEAFWTHILTGKHTIMQYYYRSTYIITGDKQRARKMRKVMALADVADAQARPEGGRFALSRFDRGVVFHDLRRVKLRAALFGVTKDRRNALFLHGYLAEESLTHGISPKGRYLIAIDFFAGVKHSLLFMQAEAGLFVYEGHFDTSERVSLLGNAGLFSSLFGDTLVVDDHIRRILLRHDITNDDLLIIACHFIANYKELGPMSTDYLRTLIFHKGAFAKVVHSELIPEPAYVIKSEFRNLVNASSSVEPYMDLEPSKILDPLIVLGKKAFAIQDLSSVPFVIDRWKFVPEVKGSLKGYMHVICTGMGSNGVSSTLNFARSWSGHNPLGLDATMPRSYVEFWESIALKELTALGLNFKVNLNAPIVVVPLATNDVVRDVTDSERDAMVKTSCVVGLTSYKWIKRMSDVDEELVRTTASDAGLDVTDLGRWLQNPYSYGAWEESQKFYEKDDWLRNRLLAPIRALLGRAPFADKDLLLLVNNNGIHPVTSIMPGCLDGLTTSCDVGRESESYDDRKWLSWVVEVGKHELVNVVKDSLQYEVKLCNMIAKEEQEFKVLDYFGRSSEYGEASDARVMSAWQVALIVGPVGFTRKYEPRFTLERNEWDGKHLDNREVRVWYGTASAERIAELIGLLSFGESKVEKYSGDNDWGAWLDGKKVMDNEWLKMSRASDRLGLRTISNNHLNDLDTNLYLDGKGEVKEGKNLSWLELAYPDWGVMAEYQHFDVGHKSTGHAYWGYNSTYEYISFKRVASGFLNMASLMKYRDLILTGGDDTLIRPIEYELDELAHSYIPGKYSRYVGADLYLSHDLQLHFRSTFPSLASGRTDIDEALEDSALEGGMSSEDKTAWLINEESRVFLDVGNGAVLDRAHNPVVTIIDNIELLDKEEQYNAAREEALRLEEDWGLSLSHLVFGATDHEFRRTVFGRDGLYDVSSSYGFMGEYPGGNHRQTYVEDFKETQTRADFLMTHEVRKAVELYDDYVQKERGGHDANARKTREKIAKEMLSLDMQLRWVAKDGRKLNRSKRRALARAYAPVCRSVYEGKLKVRDLDPGNMVGESAHYIKEANVFSDGFAIFDAIEQGAGMGKEGEEIIPDPYKDDPAKFNDAVLKIDEMLGVTLKEGKLGDNFINNYDEGLERLRNQDKWDRAIVYIDIGLEQLRLEGDWEGVFTDNDGIAHEMHLPNPDKLVVQDLTSKAWFDDGYQGLSNADWTVFVAERYASLADRSTPAYTYGKSWPDGPNLYRTEIDKEEYDHKFRTKSTTIADKEGEEVRAEVDRRLVIDFEADIKWADPVTKRELMRWWLDHHAAIPMEMLHPSHEAHVWWTKRTEMDVGPWFFQTGLGHRDPGFREEEVLTSRGFDRGFIIEDGKQDVIIPSLSDVLAGEDVMLEAEDHPYAKRDALMSYNRTLHRNIYLKVSSRATVVVAIEGVTIAAKLEGGYAELVEALEDAMSAFERYRVQSSAPTGERIVATGPTYVRKFQYKKAMDISGRRTFVPYGKGGYYPHGGGHGKDWWDLEGDLADDAIEKLQYKNKMFRDKLHNVREINDNVEKGHASLSEKSEMQEYVLRADTDDVIKASYRQLVPASEQLVLPRAFQPGFDYISYRRALVPGNTRILEQQAEAQKKQEELEKKVNPQRLRGKLPVIWTVDGGKEPLDHEHQRAQVMSGYDPDFDADFFSYFQNKFGRTYPNLFMKMFHDGFRTSADKRFSTSRNEELARSAFRTAWGIERFDNNFDVMIDIIKFTWIGDREGISESGYIPSYEASNRRNRGGVIHVNGKVHALRDVVVYGIIRAVVTHDQGELQRYHGILDDPELMDPREYDEYNGKTELCFTMKNNIQAPYYANERAWFKSYEVEEEEENDDDDLGFPEGTVPLVKIDETWESATMVMNKAVEDGLNEAQRLADVQEQLIQDMKEAQGIKWKEDRALEPYGKASVHNSLQTSDWDMHLKDYYIGGASSRDWSTPGIDDRDISVLESILCDSFGTRFKPTFWNIPGRVSEGWAKPQYYGAGFGVSRHDKGLVMMHSADVFFLCELIQLRKEHNILSGERQSFLVCPDGNLLQFKLPAERAIPDKKLQFRTRISVLEKFSLCVDVIVTRRFTFLTAQLFYGKLGVRRSEMTVVNYGENVESAIWVAGHDYGGGVKHPTKSLDYDKGYDPEGLGEAFEPVTLYPSINLDDVVSNPTNVWSGAQHEAQNRLIVNELARREARLDSEILPPMLIDLFARIPAYGEYEKNPYLRRKEWRAAMKKFAKEYCDDNDLTLREKYSIDYKSRILWNKYYRDNDMPEEDWDMLMKTIR